VAARRVTMDVLVAIFSDTAAWTIPAARVEDLRRQFPGVRFLHAGDEDAMVRLIPTAEVAFTSRLTERAFAAAPALRWVHSPAAGVGAMLFPAMKAGPTVLSNSRGMNAVAVAEHALMLMLAAVRRLPDAVRAQSAGRWAADELSGLPALRGRTLLIAGLGAIGRELARMACGIGTRCIGRETKPSRSRPTGSKTSSPGARCSCAARWRRIARQARARIHRD
jgi:phosphoglycerate dehydrogenase-like enzyme